MEKNFINIYQGFKNHQELNNTINKYSFSQQVVIDHGDEKLNDIVIPLISINDLPLQNSELYSKIQVSDSNKLEVQQENIDLQNPVFSNEQQLMRKLYHQYLIEKLKQEEQKKNDSRNNKFRKRIIDSFDLENSKQDQKCCEIF